MPNYRRNRVPGGTYFFTVNLLHRNSDILITHIDILRSAVRWCMERLPFDVDAWVVLPDHMHCMWTLPPEDSDYPSRWKSIKTFFSGNIPKTERRFLSRVKKGERGIWQRRYWEHTIRDDRDYAAHMNYIYTNPIKHGWVEHVKDWPYSSFHRDVKKGLYPENWESDIPDLETGERRNGL